MFLKMEGVPIGLYPIVDSAAWIEELLDIGVSTIQLRIKQKCNHHLKNQIRKSVQLARLYQARLFINDYWRFAIEYGAYGVHLGQSDLKSADLMAIASANLRLGISTHNAAEVAIACRAKPSYIAFGPIYSTTSKIMPYLPQGIHKLQNWCNQLSDYPIVAIGGINSERIIEVLKTGVSGVAMISTIMQAVDPLSMTKKLMQIIREQS